MRSVSSFQAVYKKCKMRFLIVATAVLACAAAAPSGTLLAAPYALAPALPTISAGDINGAAIEAHVEASDHLRAAVDANRQLNDKVSEIHGQAINNAQEQAWRAVDTVKTVEAQLDGAAAGAAPIIAKSLARTPVVAPAVAYAAPAVGYATPVVGYAAPAVSYAASAYAALPYAAAPAVYSSRLGYASPLHYGRAW